MDVMIIDTGSKNSYMFMTLNQIHADQMYQ